MVAKEMNLPAREEDVCRAFVFVDVLVAASYC